MSTALLAARLRSCDRCAATAKFHALLPSGNDLLFCGRCLLNADALVAMAAVLPLRTPGRLIR